MPASAVERVTPFVVIAHGRSGSTLLVSSLDLHPEVRCPGEPFNAIESHRGPGHDRHYRNGEDPVDFCRAQLFPIKGETAPCCGFKLHFNQMRESEHEQSLWTFLEGDAGIRIVLLRRENLFDSYVSQQRAKAAGKWRRLPGQPVPDGYLQPITIDPEDCLRHIRFSRRRIDETWARFENHPRLRLVYEDLANNFHQTMDEVWRFLGVAPIAIDQPLARMNIVDHETGISNFAELRDALAGTDLADWLR